MNKVAKIINVIIQTLAIICIVLGLFSFYHDYKAMGYAHRNFFDEIKLYLVIVEILFFTYQFFHAGIISILKVSAKQFTILYKAFWISVLVFALAGGVIFYYASSFNSSVEEDLFFIWFLGAWLVLLFYYAISIIEVVKVFKEK